MQTTRQRILQYLHLNRQATAPELSLTFDLTQANIRYHLDILEKNGQIEIIGQVPTELPGRPSHVYMLSRAAQENALDELASALLIENLSGKTSSQRKRKLTATARQLAGKEHNPGQSLLIRLGTAVQRLNDLNYKAHWEAHADSPQILLGRCPYAKIINRHPELCEMDTHMIQILTGENFEQVEKISRTQAGPAHCRFCIP
jgi:predicted ArsR family transcriptional regulator